MQYKTQLFAALFAAFVFLLVGCASAPVTIENSANIEQQTEMVETTTVATTYDTVIEYVAYDERIDREYVEVPVESVVVFKNINEEEDVRVTVDGGKNIDVILQPGEEIDVHFSESGAHYFRVGLEEGTIVVY